MLGLSCLRIARAIDAYLAPMPSIQGDVGLEIEHLRRSVKAARPGADVHGGPGRDYAAILAAAIAASRGHGTASIGEAVAAANAPLPWHYHYATRPGETDLGDRIAFAELIGPDGALDAPDCRIGFTLMAPDTVYPLHAHPAIELYLVISGHARWTTPDADRIVPPGTFVLHRSNEPHAMRTFATPLLALYGWRGAIDVAAFYL